MAPVSYGLLATPGLSKPSQRIDFTQGVSKEVLSFHSHRQKFCKGLLRFGTIGQGAGLPEALPFHTSY